MTPRLFGIAHTSLFGRYGQTRIQAVGFWRHSDSPSVWGLCLPLENLIEFRININVHNQNSKLFYGPSLDPPTETGIKKGCTADSPLSTWLFCFLLHPA
jgi:hypothetical protein